MQSKPTDFQSKSVGPPDRSCTQGVKTVLSVPHTLYTHHPENFFPLSHIPGQNPPGLFFVFLSFIYPCILQALLAVLPPISSLKILFSNLYYLLLFLQYFTIFIQRIFRVLSHGRFPLTLQRTKFLQIRG